MLHTGQFFRSERLILLIPPTVEETKAQRLGQPYNVPQPILAEWGL